MNNTTNIQTETPRPVRWSAWLGGWWNRLKRPKPRRLELRILTYSEADKLIRETNGAWTIAKEEDTNRCIGIVFLERLESMATNPPNAEVSDGVGRHSLH